MLTQQVVGSDTYRHDQKRHPSPEKFPLESESGEVVQTPAQAGFLEEHKLPAEENGLRKFPRDFGGELRCLFHGVVADSGRSLGVETLPLHINRVMFSFARDMRAKIINLVSAFEISSVHHSSLDEYEIPEHARKHL